VVAFDGIVTDFEIVPVLDTVTVARTTGSLWNVIVAVELGDQPLHETATLCPGVGVVSEAVHVGVFPGDALADDVGAAVGHGFGVGDAVGVGVGDAVGHGVGEGDAVGPPDAVGEAVGVAVAAAPPSSFRIVPRPVSSVNFGRSEAGIVADRGSRHLT
jgi:hypothetical protein